MISIFDLTTSSPQDIERIKNRAQTDIAAVQDHVRQIIADVRKYGDDALLRYTREYDTPDFNRNRLVVSESDFEEAYRRVPASVVATIKEQIALSVAFHTEQRNRICGWESEIEPGIIVGEKWTAIDQVGLYVPGGKNPFPTVQQILAVPARLAGCPRIVACISPRGDNFEVLVAAREAGIRELYRVSGAQAIAAMAYGTETIRAVDLIAGPGSPYVTAAKILSQERVAIDMPAGPSEAIILADESIAVGSSLEDKARYCAADILARAEHGPDSAGVLVTNSRSLAELTALEITKQAGTLSRKSYIETALATYSAIVVTPSVSEAISFTNEYAPEHLELLCERPREVLAQIRNAGSVFLGEYNPVAVGDYASGVNHILPTGGWAKRSSAVGIWTFMKRVQYSELTKQGLARLRPIVETISDIEGLDAHKRSVTIRFEDSNEQ